jgi:hypothetical protein
VEAALDELVLTGVPQVSNRMDINTLLNPVDESQVMDETTDEEISREIYQAVMDAQQVQENAIINGRDDDVDDDALIENHSTNREVLQAASDTLMASTILSCESWRLFWTSNTLERVLFPCFYYRKRP